MIDLPLLAAGLAVVLAVALVLAGWRMVRGPSLADRFIALDMLTATAVGFIAILGIRTGPGFHVDIAISLGLVGFLATVAFARFVKSRPVGGAKPGEGRSDGESDD